MVRVQARLHDRHGQTVTRSVLDLQHWGVTGCLQQDLAGDLEHQNFVQRGRTTRAREPAGHAGNYFIVCDL